MNEKVNISLPPTYKNVCVCELLTREIFTTSGFSDAVVKMVTDSVVEAVEELIRVTEEQGFKDYFQLSFEHLEAAISISIKYHAKIKLIPHQIKSYETPEQVEVESSLARNGLWLDLIKSRADRLFFETQGNSHVLKMIKYYREKEDENKAWVLNIIPRLKENVIIEYAQLANGFVEKALIQDPQSGLILQLGECEAWLLQQIDGEKSFDDIYMDYIANHGLFSPIRIRFLYEKLESAGLVEGVESGDEAQTKALQLWRTIANPILVLPHTEKVIDQIYHKVSKIISPAGCILFMLIGLSGLYPFLESHFEYYHYWFPRIERFCIQNPSVLLICYLLAMLMFLFHELAHGLVCRHYGGRVHRMGVMFYLVSFLFFCDTSAAWNFKHKHQRILVSLAGPLITFSLFGLSLWLAYFYNPDPYWSSVWLILAFVCFTTLAMNFNPFIKMDAYYVLVDLLEMPRLRERSFQFLWQQVGFKFMKSKAHQPSSKITTREEVIYWLYGIAGVLMTLLFILLPIVYYSRVIIKESPGSGEFLLFFLILILVLAQLSFRAFKWYQTQKYQKIRLN